MNILKGLNENNKRERKDYAVSKRIENNKTEGKVRSVNAVSKRIETNGKGYRDCEITISSQVFNQFNITVKFSPRTPQQKPSFCWGFPFSHLHQFNTMVILLH
jgi:hypothetical protein